jgi:hypothetical protein
MFHFNTDKFDFWPLYDRIKKFYPLGIRKEDEQTYKAYPGLLELQAIIEENIHDGQNYRSRWSDPITAFGQNNNMPVTGTTGAFFPSFSALVEISREISAEVTRIKDLSVFVSLAGPFYTVIAQDRNELSIAGKYFRSTNYLVVSPEGEFAAPFQTLCEFIEEHFKGFRFVPFHICRSTIYGLENWHNEKPHNSVFVALFNDHIDLDTFALGDIYHKVDDWIKEGYVSSGDGWTSYPPFPNR